MRDDAAGGSDAVSLRGTIRVADDARVASASDLSGSTLFLIARNGPAGPPLAVKRLAAGPFPLDFALGPADVMIPGMPFRGPITLSARVDRDGDALTREDVLLDALHETPLEPPAEGIELVLDAPR